MDRCFRCGRRKCETCHGHPRAVFNPAEFCPDCEDGWQGAEWGQREGYGTRSMPIVIKGTGPAIICPRCEAKKREKPPYRSHQEEIDAALKARGKEPT